MMSLPRFLIASVLSWISLTAGPLPAEAKGCVLDGDEITITSSSDITVSPPSEEPFRIRWLEANHMMATIPEQPGVAIPIRVRGAISFKATVAWVWPHLSRVVKTAHGMVMLYPGAQMANLRTNGRSVIGAVVMEADSGVPGQPAEAVTPVQIPCSALTLEEDLQDFKRSALGDGSWWQTVVSPARIRLYSRPNPKADAIVMAAHPGDARPLVFGRVEANGTWMRVSRAGDHAVVTGWAPMAELQRASEGPSSGGYGYREGPGLWGRRPRKPPYHEGLARIAVGTAIYAEHGRGPWARVESHGELFKIAYEEGDTWAEVLEIPSVLGPEIRAFVPVSATRQVH